MTANLKCSFYHKVAKMYLISLAYMVFLLLIQKKISTIGLNVIFLLILSLWLAIDGISWPVALAFGLMSSAYYLIKSLDSVWRRKISPLADSLIMLSAVALLLHAVPGFNNVLVLDHLTVGNTSSIPYTMYINYDKALAGLLLLLCLCHREQVIGKISFSAIARVVIGVAVIVGLASASLNLRLDPKWLGQASLVFILVKSFSTALVEEIAFRGVIQARLSHWLTPNVAWILASILFAIAHLGAGATYAFTALIAGLIYGYIFKKYQSILLASLCHCLVNIIHFNFLTYPM